MHVVILKVKHELANLVDPDEAVSNRNRHIEGSRQFATGIKISVMAHAQTILQSISFH